MGQGQVSSCQPRTPLCPLEPGGSSQGWPQISELEGPETPAQDRCKGIGKTYQVGEAESGPREWVWLHKKWGQEWKAKTLCLPATCKWGIRVTCGGMGRITATPGAAGVQEQGAPLPGNQAVPPHIRSGPGGPCPTTLALTLPH